MKTNNGYPSAWIVSPNDRGRKKIYLDSKVYLDNGSEFQIEMFNPLTDSVLAELKINGKLASTSGLILRPGERFFLDCNIDDRKKFIFKTYEVDATDGAAQQAIASNGFVEVSFYREKTKQYKFTQRKYCGGLPHYTNLNLNLNSTIQPPGISWYETDQSSISLSCSGGLAGPQGIQGIQGSQGSQGLQGSTIPASFNNCMDFMDTDFDMDFMAQELRREAPKTKTLKEETGRIEKGNTSNQTFESVTMDFETYCLNRVSYQLLPESKKPIETAELKKSFCSNCGNRFKGNEKFCPNCGTRI